MHTQPEPGIRQAAGQPAGGRLQRTGLLLAGIALGVSSLIGVGSYLLSRKAVLESLSASRLRHARTLAVYTDEFGKRASEKEILAELIRLHEMGEKRFRGSYIRFVRPDGVVEVESRQPGQAGQNFGELILHPSGPGGERTLGELAAKGGDWVGLVEVDGEKIFSAFANSTRPRGLVGIQVPLAEVESEVRRTVLPWAVGLGGLTTLLFLVAFTVLERVQRRGEAALRESEKASRTVAEAAADAILTIDEESIIHFVNPATEKIFGYSAAELLGQSLTLLMPEHLRHVHKAAVRRYLDTRQRHISWTGVELPGLHKSGRLIPLEISFGETVKEGRRLFSGVVRDISERKRAEEALQESEERYRQLFEANPQPLWVFDRETHRFLAVSQAAVSHYGYSQAEFLRMTIHDIRPEEDVPRLVEKLASPAAGLEAAGVWRHRKKDGSIIEVEITTHPLQFAGRPAEIVLANDITERRMLEEQLRQSQKMEAVGRLAGGIAHDFNNLLMVIAGHGELLQDKLAKDNPLRRHADEIRQTAERATALTRQLLAFSRRQVLQPRVLDLDSVVAEMESMLRRLIGEDIELVTRLNPELGRVKADPSQLEQVLMNLVVNARDAMPQGGKLTIVTDNVQLDEAYASTHLAVKPGPYVMLAVSDTGRGMDKETKAHAFEPFYTTKEKGKGTGLGLATVYGIVKQSGGNIWVYSEPGRGTTFKVYLPRVGEQVEEAVLPAAAAESAKLRGAITVLLVEDEPALRLLVRGYLESSGHKVLEAASGEEALGMAAASTGPIHLLMTDVVMPGISGRALAEQLTANHPGLKVLFMSGYTEDAIVHHGVLDAGIAFLQKPFTLTALAKKLREVMGG